MYLCNFYLCDLKSWNGDSRGDKNVMVMSSSATVSVFATSQQIDRPVLYCICQIQYKYNTNVFATSPQIDRLQPTDEYNTNTIKMQNTNSLETQYKYNAIQRQCKAIQIYYKSSRTTTQMCLQTR